MPCQLDTAAELCVISASKYSPWSSTAPKMKQHQSPTIWLYYTCKSPASSPEIIHCAVIRRRQNSHPHIDLDAQATSADFYHNSFQQPLQPERGRSSIDNLRWYLFSETALASSLKIWGHTQLRFDTRQKKSTTTTLHPNASQGVFSYQYPSAARSLDHVGESQHPQR